jgi:saccharopine dehydrogenase-like NADP-dependent oxidoreductase
VASVAATRSSIALELVAEPTWEATGVRGPEAFDAESFLQRLDDAGWGHGKVEL